MSAAIGCERRGEDLMLNCAHLEAERKGAGSCPSSFARYAIYYTPQPGTALAAFGRSWFGRANDGATLQAFSDAGLPGSGFAKIPAAPGRYTGLHALFRAPFALRDDIELGVLKSRLVTFTARRKAVETGPLTLARSGRYLVLRPVEPRPALDWLAAQCVGAFEDFAAATNDGDGDEFQHLSDYQRLLLKSFGHPHVLSEYRFSITLTGPLETSHLERVSQALWPVLEEICTSGVTVDGLSLFGDSGGRTPMRLIGRYRLGS
jgi:Protein of unknown function (DUF1045)